jgi:hypothetical protein
VGVGEGVAEGLKVGEGVAVSLGVRVLLSAGWTVGEAGMLGLSSGDAPCSMELHPDAQVSVSSIAAQSLVCRDGLCGFVSAPPDRPGGALIHSSTDGVGVPDSNPTDILYGALSAGDVASRIAVVGRGESSSLDGAMADLVERVARIERMVVDE